MTQGSLCESSDIDDNDAGGGCGVDDIMGIVRPSSSLTIIMFGHRCNYRKWTRSRVDASFSSLLRQGSGAVDNNRSIDVARVDNVLLGSHAGSEFDRLVESNDMEELLNLEKLSSPTAAVEKYIRCRPLSIEECLSN